MREEGFDTLCRYNPAMEMMSDMKSDTSLEVLHGIYCEEGTEDKH